MIVLMQSLITMSTGSSQKLPIPGSFNDVQHWFAQAEGGKPMHLQLYDEGYDIWMGNNRGTKYSNERAISSQTEMMTALRSGTLAGLSSVCTMTVR